MVKSKKKKGQNYTPIYILPEARLRLDELQLELKKKGFHGNEISLGRLVDALILSSFARDLLEKKFLST